MSSETNPDRNVVAGYYDNYKETQAEIFAADSRKVRNCLIWIAVVLFAGDLLALLIANLLTTELLLSSLLFPVIYVGLGFLAIKQPMLATVLGILVFIGIIVLTFAVYGARAAMMGWIVKAIIIYLLIAGYQSAKSAEQARKESRQ